MTDIFENIILCKNCGKEMKKEIIIKNGFKLREIRCDYCQNSSIHPQDLKDYEAFENMKKKCYKVKLRVVGNSYAVSIPKEIIDFISEENGINDIVKLYLEEIDKVALSF